MIFSPLKRRKSRNRFAYARSRRLGTRRYEISDFQTF